MDNKNNGQWTPPSDAILVDEDKEKDLVGWTPPSDAILVESEEEEGGETITWDSFNPSTSKGKTKKIEPVEVDVTKFNKSYKPRTEETQFNDLPNAETMNKGASGTWGKTKERTIKTREETAPTYRPRTEETQFNELPDSETMNKGASGTWDKEKNPYNVPHPSHVIENNKRAEIKKIEKSLAEKGEDMSSKVKNELLSVVSDIEDYANEVSSTVSKKGEDFYNEVRNLNRNIDNAGSYIKRRAIQLGVEDAEMVDDVKFKGVPKKVVPSNTESMLSITPTHTPFVQPEDPMVFVQPLGTVEEKHYKDIGAKLSSHRNQFNASDGFVYNALPSLNNNKAGQKLEGNIGVAHFFIMDPNNGRKDGSLDVYSATNEDLKHQSELYKKGSDYKRKSDDSWIPVFTKDAPKKLRVSYKKKSDISKNDKVVQDLVQVKASDIDWNKQVNEKQYSDGIYTIADKKGKPIPSLPVYDGIKSSGGRYGRFAGSGVVFLFETNGKTYATDFAGSVNNIKKEIQRLQKDYNLKEEDITMGFYDAGSYSAKPAADENGVLDRSQWDDYNDKKYSGSGVAIPKQK